jgi:membrane-bound lytic murein transglycosylase D
MKWWTPFTAMIWPGWALRMSEEGRFEQAPLEDILQMTFPVDPKLKDKVREQVAATVSQLPLIGQRRRAGYINYFSNRGHGTVVVAMQRSGRYRPMIQRILDEEGVPQELIHLAQAESGFMPRAMSSMARAGGMWQFMVWRGAEYGLSRRRTPTTAWTRRKPPAPPPAICTICTTEFGDWYLALAAYNCGPQPCKTAVERTGYADFWELRARGVLPAETTNYVPIILAMTIMEKNAQAYGLDQVQMDPPIEYDTVELTALTSLSLDRRRHRHFGSRAGRVESSLAGQSGAGPLRGTRAADLASPPQACWRPTACPRMLPSKATCW